MARPPPALDLFTPTSGFWLNAVETFFATLTGGASSEGAFRSIVELQAAINRFIEAHNRDPKPFTWIRTPDQIELNPLNASVY